MFSVEGANSRHLLITKRVLPCIFDPANGRVGCSFNDADKLLHATTHCPVASSHLMRVIIPHGFTKLQRAVTVSALLLGLGLTVLVLPETTAVVTQNRRACHYSAHSLYLKHE